MTYQPDIEKQKLHRELRIAAQPKKDECSGTNTFYGAHYFVKIAEEEEWQCMQCPERRDRFGQSIG